MSRQTAAWVNGLHCTGREWAESRKGRIKHELGLGGVPHTHHAGEDARGSWAMPRRPTSTPASVISSTTFRPLSTSTPSISASAVVDSLSVLLLGFGIAMFIAAASIALAVVLGLLVALLRLSPVAPLRWLAFAYTQVFRGVALYVLIIWVYFGLAVAMNVNIEPIPAGILTLALLNSGYLSETFRSGILAVDTGQWEAAKAMGLTKAQAFRHVIAPQATRIITPATGNQFVDAIKDSAILSVIGVPELMYETQRLAQYHFRPFEFFL